MSTPNLHEVDGRLIETLRDAGDEWGPLGVLRAAAALWPDALNGLHDWNKSVWDAGYSAGQRHERETWEERASSLRESPTPDKPEEPTGLGAVVEDAEGQRWVRIGELGYPGADDWKYAGILRGGDDNDWVPYAEINAVRTISEGVTA